MYSINLFSCEIYLTKKCVFFYQKDVTDKNKIDLFKQSNKLLTYCFYL